MTTPAFDPHAERRRLAEDAARHHNWKRFGTYLGDRQWGTVREDYSPDGNAWGYLPHDHARSRAYRFGEDGLFGLSDRQGRLCFAFALWNGVDPILKERLFGLTGPEGNHGEDVKEVYHHLDATPTHSYQRALYKYPQREYPYDDLVERNRTRGLDEPEYELLDTDAFDDDRYFDVVFEYAKAGPEDVLIRLTVHNRGDRAAQLHVLPSLWFRNTWAWGRTGEGHTSQPEISAQSATHLLAEHSTLGRFALHCESAGDGTLFTDNETNFQRLYGSPNRTPYVKDAFHRRVVEGVTTAVRPEPYGTKAAFWHRFTVDAGASVVLRLRLRATAFDDEPPFGDEFDATFAVRMRESDAFWASHTTPEMTAEEVRIGRQAMAGLLWSKAFYHYAVDEWLSGDPTQPAPPDGRAQARNHDWRHLYARDVLSLPDKWEYPWFAAWDTAFHMIPFARIDPEFAKEQLLLFLREWYMHPNGQVPAYEFAFGDVNPPVHAWACWRVYKITGTRGQRDVAFLARAFHKLLINFTWWINRKDVAGHHVFSGGFLGLDNIGVFDRNRPLPGDAALQQADGTAWMAFYCATMLSMALELAHHDRTYSDVASKFFEHFVAIADAMNRLGGSGLWSEDDGFYYDQITVDGEPPMPLKVRSIVGLMPLIAVEVLEHDVLAELPDFRKRMQWLLDNRPDLAHVVTSGSEYGRHDRLLSIASRQRLERVLGYLFDEAEFLSPFGVRSLSKAHTTQPFTFTLHGETHEVAYEPGESRSRMFGGNSNWRGPVWFPINFLLIEALERYHHFYGDALTVEIPKGSGRRCNLREAADDLNRRLTALFNADDHGVRPCHGDNRRYAADPHFRELISFHEYFHGDDGRGLGASHQTGWTALVAVCLHKLARTRSCELPP